MVLRLLSDPQDWYDLVYGAQDSRHMHYNDPVYLQLVPQGVLQRTHSNGSRFTSRLMRCWKKISPAFACITQLTCI